MNQFWKKSSKSNGSGGSNCVEVKSSMCADNACVAVTKPCDMNERVLVRDSKQNDQSDQPVLSFTREEWKAFVEGVKLGEFDLP